MTSRQVKWLLVVTCVGLLLAVSLHGSEGAEPTGWPPGTPDLRQAAVRAEYGLVGQSAMARDPDFPLLHIIRRTPGDPQKLMIVLDARNGQDTWNLETDRVIFVALANAEGIDRAYADAGFLTSGTASGQWVEAEGAAIETLIQRLLEAHRRLRAGLGRTAQTPI